MPVSLRAIHHKHGVRIPRRTTARSRVPLTGRRLVLVRRIRRRVQGQSLVLIALIVSFLAIFC